MQIGDSHEGLKQSDDLVSYDALRKDSLGWSKMFAIAKAVLGELKAVTSFGNREGLCTFMVDQCIDASDDCAHSVPTSHDARDRRFSDLMLVYKVLTEIFT